MKKYNLLFLLLLSSLYLMAQNTGIGTTTPHSSALLHVDLGGSTTRGFLVTGTFNAASTVPDLGVGSRLMFYPGKAAFRSGYVGGTLWDNASVGSYSTAMGLNSIASGYVSVSIGATNSASSDYAVALGRSNNATGAHSIAMGFASDATAPHSIAIGDNASATSDYAVALGASTTASGTYGMAIGKNTTASGFASTAMGNWVSTSGFEGAFAIGDNSTTSTMQSFVANGFRSRFAGGYRLLTNSAANLGVVLLPDGGSWGTISDVRLKENFLPVNGEQVLQKMAALPLTTWNYKAQSNKSSRHYGPMAQDFFAAFGNDDLGTIGCDTLINQQDFLGVNLVAIQALEKRTAQLQKDNAALQKKNAALEARLLKLEKMFTVKR
jgi:hypothetical protein